MDIAFLHTTDRNSRIRRIHILSVTIFCDVRLCIRIFLIQNMIIADNERITVIFCAFQQIVRIFNIRCDQLQIGPIRRVHACFDITQVTPHTVGKRNRQRFDHDQFGFTFHSRQAIVCRQIEIQRHFNIVRSGHKRFRFAMCIQIKHTRQQLRCIHTCRAIRNLHLEGVLRQMYRTIGIKADIDRFQRFDIIGFSLEIASVFGINRTHSELNTRRFIGSLNHDTVFRCCRKRMRRFGTRYRSSSIQIILIQEMHFIGI